MMFFSIKDLKTDSFHTPFPAAHQAVAIRSTLSEMSRPGSTSNLSLYPADFELWHVGSFDVERGKFKAVSPTLVTPILALKESLNAKEVDNG